MAKYSLFICYWPMPLTYLQLANWRFPLELSRTLFVKIGMYKVKDPNFNSSNIFFTIDLEYYIY